MQAVEEKFVKHLRTAALVALTLGVLTAPALASTTATPSSFIVAITAEGPSVTSLYNGVTLTTTSVTYASLLASNGSSYGSIGDVLGSLGNVPKPSGGVIGLGDGGWDGGHHFWGGGPSTSPIPEGRTLLLYAAGFALVAWAVQRRRQRSH